MDAKILDKIQEQLINSKFIKDKIGSIVHLYQADINYYDIDYIVHTQDKIFVIRVNIDTQIMMREQIKYEASLLKILEKSTVTPIVYGINSKLSEECNFGFMIRQHIKGEAVLPCYDNCIKKIANSIAKIHSLDLDEEQKSKFIKEQKIFSDRINESQRLMNNVWTDVDFSYNFKKKMGLLMNYCMKNERWQSMFSNENEFCINNISIEMKNYMLHNDKVYIIDWNRAVYSHAIQDIANMFFDIKYDWLDVKKTTCEQQQYFIDEYNKSSKIKIDDLKDKVQAYMPYLILRTLAWFANMYVNNSCVTKDSKDILHEKLKRFVQTDYIDYVTDKYIS